MKIKDLKKGNKVEGMDVYVADNAGLTYKDKRTGLDKSVLKYTFADETGQIGFVDWNRKPEDAELEKNQVIKLSCEITEYKEMLQVNNPRIQKSEILLANFMKKSKFDLDEMWGRYVLLVDKIEDWLIKKVAEELMVHEKLIKIAPAARGVHANWIGGLMEHSLMMYEMGGYICDIYKEKYFPELKKDMVLFGCLFHDLGKIWEYDYSSPSFEYSYRGELVPHIVMVCSEIEKIAEKIKTKDGLSNFEDKLITELVHIIAAHHGQLDWGSPVAPKTIEAILLHQLDMIDAKMMAPYNYMEKGEGDFTEKVWTAGVRFLRQPIK